MDTEKIKERLASLGYTYETADKYSLEYAIDKTTWRILNLTNQQDIPEGLTNIAIDMVCGEFLSFKRALGELTGYNFEQAVSSVSMGDTSVNFGTEMSPDKRFDALLDTLINGSADELLAYRKMVW